MMITRSLPVLDVFTDGVIESMEGTRATLIDPHGDNNDRATGALIAEAFLDGGVLTITADAAFDIGDDSSFSMFWRVEREGTDVVGVEVVTLMRVPAMAASTNEMREGSM